MHAFYHGITAREDYAAVENIAWTPDLRAIWARSAVARIGPHPGIQMGQHRPG